MPGSGSWFHNLRWLDFLMEVLGIILGLIFVLGTLYAASNMSEKDRDEFILMMQMFSLQQYD